MTFLTLFGTDSASMTSPGMGAVTTILAVLLLSTPAFAQQPGDAILTDGGTSETANKLDERIRQLDSMLTPLQHRVRVVSDSISRLVHHRNSLSERIEQKLDSAGLAATAIDSLATLLRAGARQRGTDRARQIRMMIEKNDLQIVSMDREIDQQSKLFRREISIDADSLRLAARDLKRLNREIDFENDRILEYQRILYRPIVARNYYMRQVEWNRSVLMLAEAYLPAIEAQLIERREQIDAIAERALLNESALRELHEELTSFHSMLSDACSQLADATARSQGIGYVRIIQSDGFRYISAINAARAEGWSVDPQIRDTINSARSNAEELHQMLDEFQAHVRECGNAYERTIADSAVTVKQLTERRRVYEQHGIALRSELASIHDERGEPMHVTNLARTPQYRAQQLRKHNMEERWNRLVTEIRSLQDSIAIVDSDTLHLRRDHDRFVRQINVLEAELKQLRTLLNGVRSVRGYGWIPNRKDVQGDDSIVG